MRKYFKATIIILFFLAVILGTAHFVLAQSDLDLGLSAGEQIGLSSASPKTVIVNVVRVLLGFLALVAVIIIMYGGFIWMTAGGNAEKIEKAKKILRNAAIGLLIILSAFAIVSFLMTKLIPPTPCVGPDCPGNCEPPCGDGLTCCPGDFCAESCGTPPPDGSFLINRTVPGNNDVNVIRNVVIRAFFNEQIDNSTDQTTLTDNFIVEDLGTIAKNGEFIAKNYPPKIIVMEAHAQSGITGSVATSSAWQEINFRPLAECGDEKDTPNCLPGSRRIQVTVNGASGIFSVGHQSLSCAGTSCRFIFTTGELIDTEGPMSGIIPAQMCKDDGTLKPDANTVGGWGRDDIAIAKLEFFSEKSGGPENLAHLEPGNSEKYQYLDWKYDTSAMNVGDSYTFKVRAEDLAASSSVASFSTTIKSGHCCNGIKDAGEEEVDCGGADCLACEGGACNRSEPNLCGVENSNCADELCSTSYCQCDTPEGCICKKRPIIYGISPYGGFCDGNINKFCRLDGDCAGLNPATCNKDAPNGAPENFLTIYGKNFGVVNNLLENVLTNINFEQGALGGVPKDWTSSYQGHSWVGIVSEAGNYVSPSRSVKLHQDSGQSYPGVCSEELCKHQGIYDKFPHACQWRNEGGTNKCVFPHDAYCGEGECKINEGQDLEWPYTNRVMWFKLVYDISKLDFTVGDRYVLRFKYKGHTSTSVNVQSGYSLGWNSQAWLKADYNDPTCVTQGGTYCSDSPGKCQCSEAPDYCCYDAPAQTKPYLSFSFSGIPPGDYSDWRSYESFFTYTDEMDRLKNRTGKKTFEVGLTVGYNATDSLDTDIYVDDFMFARVASKAGVNFVGAKGDPADDRTGVFPTDLNPNCISSWIDNQIIIAIPQEVVSGSIAVTGENGLADATDDQYGPVLKDFTANTIIRPGICRLVNDKCAGNPACQADHGLIGDTLTYYGLNLPLGSSAYFGDWQGNNVPGTNSLFGADINRQGISGVANIYPGLTTSFVVKDNINSNYLNFTKDPEPYSGPLIESFDPQTGTSTQYVTIRGRGFGNARGESQVFFGNESGIEAGYDFPKVCADSVWTDNQVIIKVPAGIADGLYLLTMKIGTVVINTSELAMPKFMVDSSEPLKPSLCKIQPVMGLIGQPVSFWGEYFGAKDANSKIKFYLNKYQPGSSGYWGKDNSTTSGIIPDMATTTVPARAISGPVKMIKNKPELEGNGLNFKVGECSKSEECGGGAVCCPSGSQHQGRCMFGDNVEEACYDVFKSCVYEWDFSTGAKIGDPCDKDKDKAKCQPDQDVCGDELVCYVDEENPDLNCTCQMPCDLKPGDEPGNEGCQKDDDKCQSELGEDYICDPESDCTCQPTYTESCSGYDINQCVYNYCSGPKKPGECSVNTEPKEGNKCNSKYCKDLCGGKACEYNETLDKCAENTLICGLSHAETRNIGGKDVQLDEYCALYNKKYRWHVKNFENCNLLGGSWRNAGGSVCADVGSECGGVCEAGLNCVGENGKDNNGDGALDASWIGVCGVDRAVCGLDYECKNGTCKQKIAGICECCCQKSENKYDLDGIFKYNPQCCAPLKCGSECGESVGKPEKVCKKTDSVLTKKKCDTEADCDTGSGETCVENLPTADFGLCSGCRVDSDNNGGISEEEQEKSDQACNCAGSAGKYCDVNTDANSDGKLDNQDGVCRECGELSYYPAKCTEHDASCCVDGQEGSVCRGITSGGSTVKEDNLAYCAYYKCGTSEDQYQCDSENPSPGLINPDSYPYDKPNCDGACGSPPGGSCYNEKQELCSLNCWMSEAYKCLGYGDYGENDTPGICWDWNKNPETEVPKCDAGDGSCLCCCDPGKTGIDPTDPATYDACQALDNKKLKCQPDKEPCTSDKRGLCCGCEADVDCVIPSEQPDLVGCGFDACCRARPDVERDSEIPKNGQTDACRNGQISAVFSERMDIQSFPSNIIVAGEYSGKCPDGTVYVAINGEEPGFFKRIIAKISGLVKKIIHFRSKEAMALAPEPGKNYCAVPGSVSGYQTAGKKTEIIFSVSKLLDPGRQYYVIIKGDENFDSRSGVLSFWKIGMNGKGYNNPDTPADDWNELESVIFNGKTYKNAHVWTFKTMDSKSENKGVCTVKDVAIDPNSYLYNTNIDDLAENDTNQNDRTFDTAYDIDKVFLSKALSKDGQVLVPVEGYSWNWTWLTDNPRVANISIAPDHVFSNGAPESDRQLIRANEKITDGETFVKATVSFNSQNTVGQKSGSVSGKANIWVFICKNPWPAIKTNGTWTPWIDSGAEEFCNAGKTGAGASCQNTNYELYYCRDSGGEGTADDLPVIDAASIFRRDPDTKILKEVYYLRGQLPAGGYDLFGLTGESSDSGNEVALRWNPQSYVDSYKIYYGVSPAEYIFNKTIDIITSGTPDGKQALCQSGHCEYAVSGLQSGQTYYFTITSYNKETGAESGYSKEVSAKAEDTTGPEAVDDAKAEPSDKQVKLEYTLANDAVSSEVFYKAVADEDGCKENIVFGGSVKSTQKDGKGTATIKSLTNGNRYCFGIASYDSSMNPSATTTVSAVPFSNLGNLKAESAAEGKARLSWDAAEGIAGYDIYQKKDGSAEYTEAARDVSFDYTFYNLDSLLSGEKYYFKVEPKNIDGVKDVYLNEASVVIK
ncbi:MAG: IPT/TIG domain-containing protein [Patescibacteria group bacterium]|jgi:hypothetical protein